jgi:hypothetical protein
MGHFYPRQAILAPVGLVTQPNEYGQYPPGALKVARNVLLRDPGKLDQSPDAIAHSVGLPGELIAKLMPTDTGIIYALTTDGGGGWSIFADGVPQTFAGSASDAFSETGRISWAQCKDRVIVNGLRGCLVRDPVPISTHFRAAGLPQPSIVGGAITAGVPAWLDQNQMVGYRVCLVRRYAEDYTLRSAPSAPVKIINSVTKGTVDLSIKWPAGAGIEPGDILELYRTDILATTSAFADPGATYKRVREYALTAADIAAVPPAALVLRDTQETVTGTLRTPGQELYTNPGVEGELYANLRPPIARCLASFKGFCFYGNTTERAQFKATFPGGFGGLTIGGSASRLAGVGNRGGSGTITLGSAVITAVSATEIVGVKVGQLWNAFSPSFPSTAAVVAVGASTITMSVVATSSGISWVLDDVIEINGVKARLGLPSAVMTLLNGLNGTMEIQLNQAVTADASHYLTGLEITLMWNYLDFDRSIDVRATNGANYSPPVPELGAAVKTIDPIVKKNRLCWSKEQQPEHAPSVSETFVGFGEMYAINPTRDAL